MSRVWLVREKKPFAAWDLLVYGVLAVLIAVLFIVFVFSDAFGVKDARGIRVEAEGETVYTYLFGEGGQIASGWEDRVEERAEGAMLYVRITTPRGWNELAIDTEKNAVYMQDADCSFRKDCTHMQAIGGGGSVIICIPHALRVMPLEGENLMNPSIG